MAANDLLLQMAKGSLDAIGNVLGEKINEGITLLNSDDDLADFKSSCKKPVGTLKNIPDEVYQGVMDSYYDALKEKDSGAVFDTLKASGKSWSEKVEDVIDTMTRPVDTKYVAIDGEDNYKISFPLSKVGIDSVASITQGNKVSILYWDNEFFGKSSMFKYFLSLWNIEQKLSNAVLGACVNVLKDNAPDLLQAAYSNTATNSEVKKILGVDVSSIKNKIKSKIQSALPKNTYLKNALSSYGTLTSRYDKLQKAISKGDYDSIYSATERFIKEQNNLVNALNKNGVEISLAALPDVQDPLNSHLKYNSAMTEASVLSGHGNSLAPANYDSRIKNIYATDFTDDIEIVGTGKNNKIYGGSGNDTLRGGKGKDSLYGGAGVDLIYGGAGVDLLYGGAGADSIFGETSSDKLYGEDGADTMVGGKGNDTIDGGADNDLLFGEQGNDKIYGDAGNDTLLGNKGNDSLWGGDGADVFYFERGDGRDIIFDYAAGEDKIFLASGSIDEVTMSGGNAKFQIGTSAITVRDALNKEIIIATETSETKYLNGEKI